MEEIEYINNAEVQDFIQEHSDSKITELVLKAHRYKHLPMSFIFDQLNGLQKSKLKIPSFYKQKKLIFPPKLNLEQASSEVTALYKAQLISGNGIDLTGGFGIDSAFISKNCTHLIHCERNEKLSKIVQYNFDQLAICNVNFKIGDSIETIKCLNTPLDFIYIDPARRDQSNKKVFKFADCEPNISSELDLCFSKAKHILIKASPIVDLKLGISELKYVKEIHVVSVGNECKEVLFLLEKDFLGETQITATDLNLRDSSITFNFDTESEAKASISLPQTYLYEAHSAINKAGAFNTVAILTKSNKLHANSHLYTSDELIANFPGRKFKVIATLPFSKKEINSYLKDKKANIAVRNFKNSVVEIRKKLNLKEGGHQYIFATTLMNNKPACILCEKV